MFKVFINSFFVLALCAFFFAPLLEGGVSFRIRVGDGEVQSHYRSYYYNDRYCPPGHSFGYCGEPLRSDFRGYTFYENGTYYYYSHDYYEHYYWPQRSYDRRPYFRKGFGIYFGVPGFYIDRSEKHYHLDRRDHHHKRRDHHHRHDRPKKKHRR